MNGKSLVWDATCVDTVVSSYLQLTSKNPGTVANQACVRKENFQEEISVNHYFSHFAVETFGTFSDPSKFSVKKKLSPILNTKSGNVHAKSFFLSLLILLL